MARRTIDVDGVGWYVYPSGRVTPYTRDEFGLVFERGTGPTRERRVTRFSPGGVKRWDAALAGLSDRRLRDLFATAQAAGTSPETGYGRQI